MARTYETTALGDTLHLYSLLAQRAERVPVEVCERYVPLLQTLPDPYPFVAAPTTRWRPAPGRQWDGPRRNEHVRTTLARCLGVTDQRQPLWDATWQPARHPYVVFCPHAAKSYKEWSARRWRTLATAVRCLGVDVEWVWAPERTRRSLTLPAVAQLMDRAHAVIAVDSGLLHLAANRGVPVVGLYGATSTLTYGPCFDTRFCVDRHAHSWPQSLPYHSARHLASPAMEALTVDMVLAQLRRALHVAFSPTVVA